MVVTDVTGLHGALMGAFFIEGAVFDKVNTMRWIHGIKRGRVSKRF